MRWGASSFALLALAIAAGACSPRPIQLELPVTASTRAMVLAIEYHDALTVTAVRVEPSIRPETLPRIRDFDGKAHLIAWLYDQTLDQLRLPEGALASTRIVGYERKLPQPKTAYEAEVGPDRMSAWVETAQVNEALSRYRYRGDTNLCTDFDLRVVEVGLADDFTAATALDAGAVLVGARSNPWLYRIDLEGARKIDGLPGFNPVAAYRGTDGRVWLGGAEGKLAVGTAETGFMLASQSRMRATLRWMDGPRGDAPFELFTMSDRGDFERFDGNRWEMLRSISTSTAMATPNGGVAWLGPGEAVALPPQGARFDTTLFRTKLMNGAISTTAFLFPSAQLGAPIALRPVEGFGAMGSTKFGNVVIFDAGGFRRIDNAPALGEPRVIVRHKDGFVLAGGGVSFTQYSPVVGFCPVESKTVPMHPLVSAPLGDGFAITGHIPRTGAGLVLIISPRP